MLSVSNLISYTYCPRKLYFEKVLKISPPLKDVMLKGTIKHKVFEKYTEKEKELVESIKPKQKEHEIRNLIQKNYINILIDLIKNYKKEFKKFQIKPLIFYQSSLPIYLTESRIRSENIYQFIKQNQVFGEELWKTLTPKYLSELRIESKELKIRGVIDKIEIHPDQYIPIELKSGSIPKYGVWPGHQLQIISYIMLLRTKYNKVNQGAVHYIDHNQKRQIIYNEILKNEVIETRDYVLNMLNSPELPPTLKNQNKCNACFFKPKCYPQSS